MRSPRVLLIAVAMLALACGKDGNPVALPTDPGNGASFTLGLTAETNELQAGSSTPVTVTITARKSDGTAPPNGTEVSVNTSLGNFGTGGDGKPIQLVSRALVNGMATVQLFPGDTAGLAKILAQSGTTVGSLNVTIVEPPPMPVADFTFTSSGLAVLFTNASTGATGYEWDFGDSVRSTDRNPSHTYPAAGTYTVTLIAKNSAGQDDKQKFVTVTVGNPPAAAFQSTVNGRQVNFVDRSSGEPTSWLWDFGDGSVVSRSQNPIHTYASAGTYTITLTASNTAGFDSTSDVVTIEASTPPVAAFKSVVDGKQVNFVDESTGDPTSWLWDFGDGGASTQKNPVHTYAKAGTYTVTLTVSNAAGSDTAADAVKIEATPPVARFKFEVNGRRVNFVDQSTGATSLLWDFGDGNTSTELNPVHTYARAGNYTVTLTASNDDGSNTAGDVVTITEAPRADFTFSVNHTTRKVSFFDRSTGNPTSWAWDFGDGTAVSKDRNPEHTYAVPGTYTVVLTVTNETGADTEDRDVTINQPPPPPP